MVVASEAKTLPKAGDTNVPPNVSCVHCSNRESAAHSAECEFLIKEADVVRVRVEDASDDACNLSPAATPPLQARVETWSKRRKTIV
jgi:hypothetical protein